MPEITYRNPDTGSIYTSSGEHIQSLEDYQSGVASGKYSGSPLDYKQAPWYSEEKTSDITTINTDDAISDLNKNKEKLDKITYPQEETSNLGEYKSTGAEELPKETKTNNLTFDEVAELFGNDFSGIKQNADGTFTPTSSAYERIGITGLEDTEDTQLEGDLQELDNTITTLTNNFLNYNVENDPAYQSQVQNITQQYDKMRSEMSTINTSRKRALETLGYRTGSTQYAGAVQLGIVGEEIKQGDERIMEITRQENEAKSAARQAFETQNYTKFAQTMDALETLRTNKAEELTRYNNKLAEANKLLQEQAKFELDVLKYQLDLKKSTETDLTKEYDIAKSDGFDGTLMDYKLWQEEIKKADPSLPSSYKEWQLAGGLEGTGKSYGEFIAKSDKGPASYQEWSLAGKEGGTGKTYAEFLGGQNGLSNQVINQIDKVSSSFDSSPIVKQFNEVLNKKISVDTMVAGATSGPVDLALVFEFMKALDPTSVVRESEYDAASKTGTIFEGWAAKFNGQFKEGQMLPDEVRQEFKRLVGIKFDAIKQQYSNLRDEKARLINQKTGGQDGKSYLIDYGLNFNSNEEITLPELRQSYESITDLLYENPEYADFIQNKMRPIFDEEGIEMTDENVLQYLQESSFNKVGSDTQTGQGMRTDRSNNPVAFTTDIAKQAGLVLGVDYTVGDAFPNNPNLHTAKLIGNPVDKTIAVIDKIGFYTSSGKQRWTHTAINKSQWDKMSYQQKKDTIKKMYQAEGNEGLLNKYFA